jgi:hypothetical protein
MLLTLFVLPGLSQTLSYTFISIDYPDALQTVATGINQSGQIVGAYMCARHEFLIPKSEKTG